MAKNYSKASKTRRQPARSSKRIKHRDNSGKLWVLAVILLAVFITGLAYLERKRDYYRLEQQPENAATPVHSKQKLHPEQQVTAKLQKTTPAQPKFDFYTMLPGNETAAPKPDGHSLQQNNIKLTDAEQQKLTHSSPETSTTVNRDQQTISSPAQTNSYMLQLGIFNDFARADALKATLAMQGFETKIKTFKQEDKTLYRVMLGPYANRHQAERQQALLRANQVKGEILETR